MNEIKLEAMLKGHIVGDVVGVPFEFISRNKINAKEMIGHGESYIIEQYEQSIDEVEEEIIYVLDQIFDIFDAKLESTDGKKFKFCWAGIN